MSKDALSLLEEVPTLDEEIDGAKTFGQSSLNLEEQMTHHSMTCCFHVQMSKAIKLLMKH